VASLCRGIQLADLGNAEAFAEALTATVTGRGAVPQPDNVAEHFSLARHLARLNELYDHDVFVA
jgi:hypothetical protein